MAGVDPMVLAQMRAVADRFMTDTCTISKLGRTRGEAGEIITEWITVASSVACRMIQESVRKGGETQNVAERPDMPERYRVALPHTVEVDDAYRMTLDSDGSQWLVTNVVTSQTDMVTVLATVIPEVN